MKQYSKTHEWVEIVGDKAKIGLSDYAQKQLGDIVYVSLPMVGDKVTIGKSFCDVESVKAVSEVYSPVDGTVTAINEELLDQPELVNQKPLDSYIIEVTFEKVEDLLDEQAYQEFITKE